MSRNRWLILVGVVLVIGVAVWFWRRGSGGAVAVDLVQQLPQAIKRSLPKPPDQSIKQTTVTINGETKTCILAQAHSRITYPSLVPPADAWFTTSIAVDPSVWNKEGDGVLFRVGVSAPGQGYEELLNLHVNPIGNASDRRWIPVSLDLSAYAGRKIDLILNTNASLPGKGNDARNDLALWAAPVISVGH